MPKDSLSKIEKAHLGVQILAQATTIIAAIVVAIWGYYSTVYVNKEKEVTEYTLKELDQKTTQKPHIQAKVESKIQKLTDGQNLLQVKVIISNLGNKESRVTLDDDALTLVPVAFAEGKPIYNKPINLHSGRYAGTLNRAPLRFVDVGAGESYEITFVQNLENPGIYLIHFLALNGINPPAEDLSITGGVPYQYSVGADQYVVVK
ncbi:hypothetical protein QOT92_11730 [Pseudomonas aeruginosa]|uniref:hypothetical protein n=1 Tax=Pseudomonas aeruginosa TaxID=287 RepID=UPI000689F0CC|nr:hypothetical protein [Pseudomonas aeruginosa]MBV5947096.1 hypothetical protein [Pseudomonas aeruginosa]MCO3334125.1 hypothetical protein [Pseudomonas aeruginosa]NQC39292.1 hypothetical protein [Pseudomonas aeruginosa]RIZ45098.1 hypothetical protein AXX02_02065 [Pseudomonas aeruginosa]HBO1203013.1 hypothetical protein [Pseudomonas aeruginosa]